MPGLFAITTATNSVPLDSNRQGHVAFTVSNRTERFLRSHARLWSQPIVANAWVKLVGEVERDLAGGESQHYVVQIAVPADTAAGEYLLRLDMVDVSDPDETLSEGPTVKFIVLAPVAVEPKPFPWWIIAAAVLAVLLLVGGIYGIARAGQKKPGTPPVAAITATPTLIPTPTPTPPLTVSTWSGMGSESGGNFNMLLQITTVQGNDFSGLLTENPYGEVTIVGHIVSSSPGSTQITFTDPAWVIGDSIALHCTYNATVAQGQMRGTWAFPGDTNTDGTIALSAV